MPRRGESKLEFVAETFLGPFPAQSLPDGVRLLPRRPIWECHGGKVDPSCRNIDDCLVGEQNGAVGLSAVHRPCTVDTLVAGVAGYLNNSRRLSCPAWLRTLVVHIGRCHLGLRSQTILGSPRAFLFELVVCHAIIGSPQALRLELVLCQTILGSPQALLSELVCSAGLGAALIPTARLW